MAGGAAASDNPYFGFAGLNELEFRHKEQAVKYAGTYGANFAGQKDGQPGQLGVPIDEQYAEPIPLSTGDDDGPPEDPYRTIHRFGGADNTADASAPGNDGEKIAEAAGSGSGGISRTRARRSVHVTLDGPHLPLSPSSQRHEEQESNQSRDSNIEHTAALDSRLAHAKLGTGYHQPTSVSGSAPSDGDADPAAAGLVVGRRAKVNGLGEGVVRFLGPHHETGEARCGVELDEQVGFMDGSEDGHRYFECEWGRGVLAPFESVTALVLPKAAEKGDVVALQALDRNATGGYQLLPPAAATPDET